MPEDSLIKFFHIRLSFDIILSFKCTVPTEHLFQSKYVSENGNALQWRMKHQKQPLTGEPGLEHWNKVIFAIFF